MQKTVENILKCHGLRKTEMRCLVLKLFLSANREAITHPELERRLPDADRITLYRSLKSFEEKGIIHQVVDGSQATKFALCTDTCNEHEHLDQHAHFHCNDCGKTICLEEKITASFVVPDGFEVAQAHLVLKGKCDGCYASYDSK